MVSIRTDSEEDAVARISAAAREFIVRTYREERQKNPWLEYPNVPDYADLEDELRPYIEREICQAILLSRRNPNFDLGGILFAWNRAETEIAKRNAKRPLPPLLGPGSPSEQ